jgi:HEAT repeat protein
LRVRAVRWPLLAVIALAIAGLAPRTPCFANGWEHGAIPFEALVKALQAESPDMRARGARSLGLREQQRGVAPLLARLQAPEPHPAVRSTIYAALGHLGATEAVPALLQCLVDEQDDEVRATCAGAAGKIGAAEALPALLRSLETDPSFLVRTGVVEALGGFSQPDAVAALTDLIEPGGNASLRTRAIRSLGQTGADAAVGPLVAALEAADGASEQTAIVQALGELGHPDSGAALERLIAETKDADLRLATVVALGAVRDGDARDTLEALLDDPDPAVQLAAVLGLRHLGQAAAAAAVLRFYEGLATPAVEAMEGWTGEVLVRALATLRLQSEALRALGDLDPVVGLPAFLDAAARQEVDRTSQAGLELAARIYQRRRLALHGLGYTKARSAFEVLSGPLGLHDEDPRLRAVAVRSLGVLGFPEAVALVIGSLGDESRDVRWTGATVLGLLGDRQAVAALLGALEDPVARVREESALALGYLGDVAARDRLLGLAEEDANEAVREAARFAAGLLEDRGG